MQQIWLTYLGCGGIVWGEIWPVWHGFLCDPLGSGILGIIYICLVSDTA